MNSESNNKDNILFQSYQGEGKNDEKEEIINSQFDKSKKENNNEENKTITNYPYEFYEENKEQIEFKQNEVQENEEQLINKIEVRKEEKTKIETIPEKTEQSFDPEIKQIIKNQNAQKELEDKNINLEQKILIKEAEDRVFKEGKKEMLQEVGDKFVLETINQNKKEEKKEIKAKEKKIVKEEKNVNKKESKNAALEKRNDKSKEIPKEKKIIKEEEKKVEKKESKDKLRSSNKKDENLRKIILKNMEKEELEAHLPPNKEHIPPKVKEIKMKNENKKNKEKKPLNQFQKTKLTQQTEDNYNLMIQQLKNKDYKNAEDHVINNIINSDNQMPYKDNSKIDNFRNKELIEDFLQRNIDDIKYRQNNNKTINDRFKIADENGKKKLYFNNKEEEQEYFNDFYNKQIQYKNDYQINLNKLTQQINEEKEKNYVPEPKNKTNLNYFKNKNSVKLPKYKKDTNIKPENKKVNENEKNSTPILKSKKSNNIMNNKQNINSKENSNNKLKEAKNDNSLNKAKPKLTKKEIDELTNKLHYEGELLKVKKQTMISDEYANNPIYHNFSKDKLSRASLIILIKKFIYEYSTTIKNNTYLDCIKNPKLNYEQYIDVLKDLYYLEKDALPEDYLEDDTMYKELWDKLTKFSKGPENSLESNVLLLYFLELNGFFRNEKLVKELETEIHWIKLEEYEELIANAKFIEENWDDLKLKKIENIKRLKSLKIYNPIHNEEMYNSNNNNVNSNPNINQNSININESNHYITIIRGNTDYELIHGYSTKKKEVENDSFSDLSNEKNKVNNYNSLTMSNNISKTNKNRINLQEGYNEIILKKKTDIEYLKRREENKLKETCTFKPIINPLNKKMFNNNIKVDLPKHRMNKSANLFNSVKSQNENKSKLAKSLNGMGGKNSETIKLRKNKSNLQKMFDTNPLKDDKIVNERVQKLKTVKINEINDDNYMITPMRFNIDYPSKFEGMGITINRDSSIRQFASNIIFYNIKVNDKIRTLKYIEGDDLKLNVINFVKKNKLPDEVVNIILKKIKEKELEEKANN